MSSKALQSMHLVLSISHIAVGATEELLQQHVGDDVRIPSSVVAMASELAAEMMRSLLVHANQVAHEEAKKESYSIAPAHVLTALAAYPELAQAVEAMPKADKKSRRGKTLFKGEAMEELIAAQNALFEKAKEKHERRC